MGAAQLGYFIGGFAMALLFAVVWLLIAYVVPSLRRRPSLSYGIAMAFAFLPSLVAIEGPSLSGLVASALCCPLLFWQMRRAQEKLRGPGTSKT